MVVVDLDSTLCNTSHRHGKTPREDPSLTWADYSMLCADDEPMEATIQLVHMLDRAGYAIHLVSFREDQARDLTIEWLAKYDVPYEHLTMKGPDVDSSTHDQYKADAVQKLLDEGRQVALVLDDWPGTAEAVERRCGVPVLVVNPCYQEKLGTAPSVL